jgi:hypothetical protein
MYVVPDHVPDPFCMHDLAKIYQNNILISSYTLRHSHTNALISHTCLITNTFTPLVSHTVYCTIAGKPNYSRRLAIWQLSKLQQLTNNSTSLRSLYATTIVCAPESSRRWRSGGSACARAGDLCPTRHARRGVWAAHTRSEAAALGATRCRPLHISPSSTAWVGVALALARQRPLRLVAPWNRWVGVVVGAVLGVDDVSAKGWRARHHGWRWWRGRNRPPG